MISSLPSKKTRIHVSKNRKKSWGKYCDIKDVEDYLENKRLEERTGGLISEKKDEELFVIDVTKTPEKPVKKKRKGLCALKCHKILNAYSQIPPPVNPIKRPPGKKKKQLLEKREIKKLKKALSSSKISNKGASETQIIGDLWAEKEEKEIEYSDIKDLLNYRDEITRKRPVNVPDHRYQKPSLLPAVEVPHPGASYNPTFHEHQNLLSKAVEIEQKKLKEELHLKRILNDMFPSKEDAPTEETYLKEMSQGLFDEDGEENDVHGDSTLFANPRVTGEDRKSKSKRRKEKQLKYQLQKKELDKQMNRKMNNIHRLKQIKAEIKEADKITAQRMARRQQRAISKMYGPRTLSRHKFQPADLEVNLSEELPESMRVLKVEGNLLEDRYKSLQKRNIIETRIRQSRKRKYKLKTQIKRSHRDFQ